MLLTRLRAQNSQGDILEFPLENPSNGYVVRDIQGMGPVKATLVSSSYAMKDGARYHTSRREPRNIVIQLGLTPDYGSMNPQHLRASLYRYFMPKTSVKLFFDLFDRFDTNIITQNLNVEIDGRVESFEVNQFTKDPTVDLSIICYDPDFVDPVLQTFNGDTVDDLTEVTLDYSGSVDTGVLFTLLPDSLINDFSIYHVGPEDRLSTINFTLPLSPGDTLEINSVVGNKYANLRDITGVETSVLYGVTSQSAWLELKPGPNRIRVYTTDGPVPYKIEYTNKYGGL